MVSTIHSFVIPLELLIVALSALLTRRIRRDLESLASKDNRHGLVSLRAYSDLIALHRQSFPNSHLGLALQVSLVGLALSMVVWAVTTILIP